MRYQVSHQYTRDEIIILHILICTVSCGKQEDRRFWSRWQEAFPINLMCLLFSLHGNNIDNVVGIVLFATFKNLIVNSVMFPQSRNRREMLYVFCYSFPFVWLYILLPYESVLFICQLICLFIFNITCFSKKLHDYSTCWST